MELGKEEKPPPKVKKRASNKTSQQLFLESHCKERGIATALQHQVIPCSLHKATGKNSELCDIFFANAVLVGAYRYWVGALAGYDVVQSTSEGRQCSALKKTYYDKIWSALDRFKDEKSREGDRFDVLVASFFSSNDYTPMDLPPKVKFELRSPTTRDMATTAKQNVIRNFDLRVLCGIKSELYDFVRRSNIEPRPKALDLYILASTIRNAILGNDVDADSLAQKAYDAARAVRVHIELVKGIIVRDRASLAGLRDPDPDIRIGYVVKKEPHRFLNYLAEINSRLEFNKARYFAETTEEERAKKKGAIGGFGLMPEYVLQPAFIELARTQLVTMFGKARIDATEIGKGLFDIQAIPQGKRMYKWLNDPNDDSVTPITVVSYQTDGVQLSTRFVMPKACRSKKRPRNIDALIKKGYDIDEPRRKLRIGVDKGVCKIDQKRCDVSLVIEEQDGVEVVSVDPGVNKVISCCKTSLNHAISAESVIQNGEFFSVSNEQYQIESGKAENLQYEKHRRTLNQNYQLGIGRLLFESRKTSSVDTYLKYYKTYKTYYATFFKEKMHLTRRIRRWRSFRKSMSALAKMADSVAGTESKREEQYKIKTSNLSDEEREILLSKLQTKLDRTSRVVFFGDGQFRTGGHGHASVPRKALIHQLACRSLCCLTSEFGTSKYCPGCGSTMEDVEGETRTRSCSNSCREGPSACCLQVGEKCYTTDRDDCGAVGIMLCGANPVVGNGRPKQYCRTSQIETSAHPVEER